MMGAYLLPLTCGNCTAPFMSLRFQNLVPKYGTFLPIIKRQIWAPDVFLKQIKEQTLFLISNLIHPFKVLLIIMNSVAIFKK
jgi:hypothetical protein